MSKDITKDHSRRAMKYLVELSDGDINKDDHLEAYHKYRKVGQDRVYSLVHGTLDLLIDKIIDEINSNDRMGNDVFDVFEYKSFIYRLEVRDKKGTDYYEFALIGTDHEGDEYEAAYGESEEYNRTLLEGIEYFIHSMVYYAISNT